MTTKFDFPLVLGRNKEFKLDERALRHILEGEFSKRPEIDISGQRVARDVIAGGLHTWKAWMDFLTQRPEITHLHDFDPNLHSGWYFARELQNGVITLKIPRELFSKDAASITMKPDVLFKSGYLWKTLFPRDYSLDDVISVISEALVNISIEESQLDTHMKVIIGYARTMEPFSAIRIRIQTEGELIRSAFPSWDQPNTGNNGKPYSPEQSLSFPIAESTLGATGATFHTSRLFTKDDELSILRLSILKLIDITPDFVIKRPTPKYGTSTDRWRDGWVLSVERNAAKASSAAIQTVVNFLGDFLISKEPFFLQSRLSKTGDDKALRLMGLANCANIMQNINDCFLFLLISDNQNKSRNFIDFSNRFLATAVIHTGHLNLLEYKRLLKVFFKGAWRHHADDAIKVIWESVSASPWRIAAYSEINIYPYFKKNDEVGWSVIGGFHVEAPVTAELVYDWAATNLGETYLISFSKKQCLKIAESYVRQGAETKFVEDVLKYFTASDFDFLSQEIDMLVDLDLSRPLPAEASMIEILREYDKMLLTYRQRIVLEDQDSYRAEIDYGDRSPQSFNILKQKHKRAYVMSMHQTLFDAMQKISGKWDYKKLSLRNERLREKMGKEMIPVPVRIPGYIKSWETESNPINCDIDGFVQDPFFGRNG